MRRSIASLLAGSLIAGTLVLAAPPAQAASRQIVFVSGRPHGQAGMFEIWSLDPAGVEDPVNMTRAPESVDLDPASGPLTGDVAFVRQTKNSETTALYTMDGDGGNKTSVDTGKGAHNVRDPDWAPTDDRIVFVRALRAEGTSHIYTVTSGGTGLTQLTNTAPPAYDAGPVWAPNGASIAFVSDRTGTPQIYTMDPAGGSLTQRTTGTCFASNPSWSADSMDLAYEQQCSGADADIMVLDLGTSSTSSLVGGPESDHQPSFSEDGTELVFTRIESNGDKNLYSVGFPVPGAPSPLTDGIPEADMAPDWGVSAGLTRTGTGSLTRASSEDGDEVRSPRRKGGKGSKDKGRKARKGKKGKKGKKRFRVSRGVKYQRMRKAKSDVHVLKVNPKKKPSIDVSLSNDRLSGHEKTKRMAKRNGAIAAVNGDFGMPSGRPSHTFAEDGDLKQVSFAVAWSFAIAVNERQTFFDRPFETITAEEGPDDWRIERWNFGEPAWGDIAAFTAAGGTLEVPPGNTCAARLMPTAGPRWSPGMTGVETPYLVAATGCNSVPMGMDGGIVLAAQPGSIGALLLESLAVNEPVEIGWSLGWQEVADSVGGTPLLVENGARVAKKCGASICKRHPRTAIGVTGAGKILLVVIDGRSDRSKGVTIVKLANIMRKLGAVFALNLDGGGSSTMVIRGKVMNDPSDGKQRRVSSAVLVMKGRDKRESIGAAAPLAPARSSGGGGGGEAALLDPASTGGLLEAMAAGTFGPRIDLPPQLDRALRRFREG